MSRVVIILEDLDSGAVDVDVHCYVPMDVNDETHWTNSQKTAKIMLATINMDLRTALLADKVTTNELKQCCERDHNFDGNCDIHASPGVLRNE